MSVTFEDLIRKHEAEARTAHGRWSSTANLLANVRAKAAATTDVEELRQLNAQVDELNDKLVEYGETLTHANERLARVKSEKDHDDELTRQSRVVHETEAGRALRESRDSSDVSVGSVRAERDEFVRRTDGTRAALRVGERWGHHPVLVAHAGRDYEREQAIVGQHGSLGQLVRAMTTSSGSAMVPTTWASDVIDRARNYAAVLQAGAQIVPMDAKTVQIGRLTADPTAAFRTEGSTITASDPTFDNVTLDAKTMSALVVGSLEWFQDAADVDAIVTDAIARAIGLQLDLVGLYGSITSGAGSINLATPPNPRGILGNLLANAASSVLGAATNGTAQTSASYWNEVLDTIYTPRDYNEAPGAMIWNSKLARQYAKAYDTTGQPLQAPADVRDLPAFVSNQIPSYTQGTMTSRATDLFVGDFTQLVIGQRLDLTIQTLTERYAENGQVGIVAHWRGDVQLARPRAFAVYRALQGAS